MARTATKTDSPLREALRLGFAFAAAKLFLHFALTLWSEHLGYGYFRDEFYYLACGHHLAWGFVDHGPIVAVQARFGETLFGTSVFAIRIFSALAGAGMVLLTGVLAWALGGRHPAQALAMLGVICCPQFLGTDGYLSMNSFEPIFWGTCILAVLLLQRGCSPRLCWILFGASAGAGLLNKPSMAFFLAALVLALLCTRQRGLLFTRWAALGVALMSALALPNLLWQVHNHWPTLEFLKNGREQHKNVVVGPFLFFLTQCENMQPLNGLLWIAGILALLRARSIQGVRWLGLAYCFFFLIMLALHAKDYYLAAIYPPLFAAGAVAWQRRFAARRLVQQDRVVAFPVFEGALLATTLLVLPMASPVLRPAVWVRYTRALHLHNNQTENSATGPLPQFYADRFGWREQADTVVRAYRALTPAEQKRVCIYGDNYGEAGALDLLGKREEPRLPAAISPQNSYWMWGMHGCDTGITIAISGGTPEDLSKEYASVTVLAYMANPWSMPFEHKNIYLLRGRLPSAPLNWRKKKNYI